MSEHAILLPSLAHLYLIILLFGVLAVRRYRAVKEKAVDAKQAVLDNRAWPKSVIKVSNNITNQFEAPIIFHIVCLMAFALDMNGMIPVGLAFAFVIFRYLHAFVHITSNYIPYRFASFIASVFTLLILMVLVTIQLFSIM
ncbi:MAPEG family protein [Endozoicomonas ascidiicola]|uniref:MAPEG family protein n=1 Tax=Endozoicomonas ascidiicola TaxID=1698521 RepID=UPI00082E8630|nr:MAPEG family protein [Endozoicomonas ascidiicola]